MKQHILLIVPPLGTGSEKIGEKITKNWNKDFGIKPINWQFFWIDNDEGYDDRLNKLIDKIDEISNENTDVSLLGLSAGGSVVLNVFCQRTNKISKVINVGGRLKSGNISFPKSKLKNDNNSLFKESVARCEKNIKSLNVNDRRKILTVRPLWDEFVPTKFATVEGARNIQVIAVEHIIGLILSMTIYKKIIIDFLN
jgi:hypothetical protein